MRCLVIEDDVDTSKYIANGLRQAGHEVRVTHDGAEGLQLAMSETWSVIVLDRMLPNNVDGLSIVATLRGLGKKTPVLILSALGSLDERVKGLKEGGDDYLTKPFAFSELMARLEALERRNVEPEPVQQLSVADLSIDLTRRRVERAGQVINLQPREFRLLVYLVLNQGTVVTRTMLLESVWDYHFDPQTNVIDVQISRLRNKVDQGFEPALIHTVRGKGYVLSPFGTAVKDE